MDQMWGIIAAGLFGVGGAIGGAYVGLIAGRRQTRDQADIEHGQWLRNQRQEAYVQLLGAWDQAVTKLVTLVDEWDIICREMDAHGQADEFEEAVQRRTAAAWETTSAQLERVTLLGPEQVDAVVSRLETAFDEAQAWLNEQAAPDVAAWDVERWTACVSRLHRVRREFMGAAREEIRVAPQPGR